MQIREGVEEETRGLSLLKMGDMDVFGLKGYSCLAILVSNRVPIFAASRSLHARKRKRLFLVYLQGKFMHQSTASPEGTTLGTKEDFHPLIMCCRSDGFGRFSLLHNSKMPIDGF